LALLSRHSIACNAKTACISRRSSPRDCLSNYRNRTEALHSLANRDLLRFLAGREDQDAGRFGRLSGQPSRTRRKRRS